MLLTSQWTNLTIADLVNTREVIFVNKESDSKSAPRMTTGDALYTST
jgi:hypothetical protein